MPLSDEHGTKVGKRTSRHARIVRSHATMTSISTAGATKSRMLFCTSRNGAASPSVTLKIRLNSCRRELDQLPRPCPAAHSFPAESVHKQRYAAGAPQDHAWPNPERTRLPWQRAGTPCLRDSSGKPACAKAHAAAGAMRRRKAGEARSRSGECTACRLRRVKPRWMRRWMK